MDEVCVIVQARMTSTRLPGKVLKKVMGKTLLEYLVERLKRCRTVDSICIATTVNSCDDPIVDAAKLMGVSFSRGSELDVLDRYAIAAETHGAETVVRVTSDCPLMDPAIIDELVDFYHKGVNGVPFDYVSNSLERKYPLGFEAEVFSTKALLQAHKSARLPAEREHVTVFIRNHPELFNLGSFCGADDAAHLRVTVDTEEDFRLIEKILGKIYLSNPSFTYQDVVTLLRNTPELVDINRHVIQKKAIS